uniref:Leucine-rich repeat-containing protein let-4-like n=1 Tax=Diabrotica virgifera virgifera TaxID=50390 RepID=A0A6P7FXF3_DIAVI
MGEESESWKTRHVLAVDIAEIQKVIYYHKLRGRILAMFQKLIKNVEDEVRIVAVRNLVPYCRCLKESYERTDQVENNFESVFIQSLVPQITMLVVDTCTDVKLELAKNILSLSTLISNQLTHIAKGVFYNVPVHSLNFINNKISKLDKGSLDDLSTLRSVDLSNNNIEDSKLFTLGFLNTPLDYLSLSDNGISNIDIGVFKNTEIKTLNLNKNHIKSIKKGVFQNVTIQSINLSDNEITEIEEDAFDDIKDLRHIDVSLNKLEVKKRMFSLPLDKVNLEDNVITKIDIDALNGLPLSGLRIKNNPIAAKNNA